MSVYVDNMRAPYRRMIMCHMIADSTAELIEMAEHIGVPRKWIQDAGTPFEHFDICLSARQEALDRGAIAITVRALALKLRERRHGGGDALAALLKQEMHEEKHDEETLARRDSTG